MTSEHNLIQQMKQGNNIALSELYDKYSGALYGVIFRMCKNKAIAADLLQETFVKIWQKADSYDPEKGKFYTWAYRIARNCALNELRKRDDLIQNEDLSVYSNTPTLDDTAVDTVKLNGAIQKLESHHQKALELIYFNGLTHKEAHEAMDVPLGTFKSYVQQALKKLRESYQISIVISWSLIGCML